MKVLIPSFALAAAFAAAVSAQDSTVTSKTEVKADDARTVMASGCLQQTANIFTLKGAVVASGEDLTSKTRVRTDVDKDDTTVKADTTTKIENDRPVGTTGGVTTYTLAPRAGVDLSAHVGKQVQISAVMVPAAKGGDDDAEVKVKETTKADVDDAPDTKVETRTRAELPRGASPSLMVVSVKEIGPACTN